MTSLRDLLDQGLSHHRAGRLEAAAACYGEVLARSPEDSEANHLSGVLDFQSGRFEDAVARFRRAAERDPGTAKYHGNLGAALLALRRYGEAVEALHRAVAIDPDGVSVQVNLATACRESGRLDDAIAAGTRAVALAPRDADARTGLALSLVRAERYDEALAVAEAAVALGGGEAFNALGLALQALDRDDEALAAFERAVAVAPQAVELRCNLGRALRERYRYEGSAAQYRAAIDLQPNGAAGYAGLARTLKQQGDVDAAMPLYRRAVSLDPGNARYHSNLLFNLLGSEQTDGGRLLDEHRAWATRFAAPLAPRAPGPWANARDPGRRLRVGYVSPDLGNHPVGRLLLPVLHAHDPSAVEIVCYSATVRRDAVNQALRAAASLWRDVATMDDAALAAQVRADGIDVLVDLAGHTARHRLLAFARRAAPVQATWLGYVSTTGMEQMDWIIADPVHAPPGSEGEFAERVMRLPHDLLCFAPPDDAPEVGPLPCRAAGSVTFGSFNNLGKLSAATLALWSRVLGAVPDSRMLIRYHLLEDEAARDQLRRRFAAVGVDPARLEFAGKASYRTVLDTYNRVDIALDTTPYSGTMTTLEALWMGVPVITVAGDRMTARQSAAHLSAAGLGELVAPDEDGYVALAHSLAADAGRLADLRAGMRDRLRASPLCDVTGFTRALENAYRAMWRDWCKDGR